MNTTPVKAYRTEASNAPLKQVELPKEEETEDKIFRNVMHYINKHPHSGKE